MNYIDIDSPNFFIYRQLIERFGSPDDISYIDIYHADNHNKIRYFMYLGFFNSHDNNRRIITLLLIEYLRSIDKQAIADEIIKTYKGWGLSIPSTLYVTSLVIKLWRLYIERTKNNRVNSVIILLFIMTHYHSDDDTINISNILLSHIKSLCCSIIGQPTMDISSYIKVIDNEIYKIDNHSIDHNHIHLRSTYVYISEVVWATTIHRLSSIYQIKEMLRITNIANNAIYKDINKHIQ